MDRKQSVVAAVPPPELQQAQPTKAEPRKISLRQDSNVDTDRKWLEAITKEEYTRMNWEKRWGYIHDLQKDMDEELQRAPLPRHRMNKEKDFKPKVAIKVLPSPPIPGTSSAIVGWRCSKDFWIENFGPLYVSPRHTIEPKSPELPLVDEMDEEEESKILAKLDPRRSGLYTTSLIFLK